MHEQAETNAGAALGDIATLYGQIEFQQVRDAAVAVLSSAHPQEPKLSELRSECVGRLGVSRDNWEEHFPELEETMLERNGYRFSLEPDAAGRLAVEFQKRGKLMQLFDTMEAERFGKSGTATVEDVQQGILRLIEEVNHTLNGGSEEQQWRFETKENADHAKNLQILHTILGTRMGLLCVLATVAAGGRISLDTLARILKKNLLLDEDSTAEFRALDNLRKRSGGAFLIEKTLLMIEPFNLRQPLLQKTCAHYRFLADMLYEISPEPEQNDTVANATEEESGEVIIPEVEVDEEVDADSSVEAEGEMEEEIIPEVDVPEERDENDNDFPDPQIWVSEVRGSMIPDPDITELREYEESSTTAACVGPPGGIDAFTPAASLPRGYSAAEMRAMELGEYVQGYEERDTLNAKHPTRSTPRIKNIIEAIKSDDGDDFEPMDNVDFEATQELPGSSEKLAILEYRIQHGLPLWHPNDKFCYDGLLKITDPQQKWSATD